MTKNNFLFLDLSSKSTGWAIATKDGKIINHGLIVSSSPDTVQRISYMQNEIGKLISENDITNIVTEEVRPDFINIRTYKVLMWLQGSIVLKAHDINPKISIEYLYPSEWRSKIGIKTGRGVKREQVKAASIKYVKNKYGINANDDVCDAICLLDSYFAGEQSAWSK